MCVAEDCFEPGCYGLQFFRGARPVTPVSGDSGQRRTEAEHYRMPCWPGTGGQHGSR